MSASGRIRPVPWQTISSNTIVADRWIRLRADECVDAAGRTISPFYVLEPSELISVLAVDVDGSAIVVEEYRHGAGIVALGTVGGGVEPGETPRDAAVRELREETGFEAQEMITVRTLPIDSLGDQLQQSYHQLTWYKALPYL